MSEAPMVSEYVFSGQLSQVSIDEAPLALEYVPASQAVHASMLWEPDAEVYVPAKQSVHSVELVGDQVPGSQEVQAVEADDNEYVPAEQILQSLTDTAAAVLL